MRLPECQKALLDAGEARNANFESTLNFLTLPATLFTTLCAYYRVIFIYRPIGLIATMLVVRSLWDTSSTTPGSDLTFANQKASCIC